MAFAFYQYEDLEANDQIKYDKMAISQYDPREIALMIQLWRVLGRWVGWVGWVGDIPTTYIYPARWGWINDNIIT